jgi:hypothetical protein
MNPCWNIIISLLVYLVIAIASYMMGRNDECKKWAEIWFNQWKTILEGQAELEARLIRIMNEIKYVPK